MSILKKSKAIYYDKMNTLSEVTISEDKIKLHLNYSSIDLKVEEIPKLLSDVLLLYSVVRPILEKKSEELEKEKLGKNKDGDVEKIEDIDDLIPIDLSEIPF